MLRGKLSISGILQAIEDGLLAVTRAPSSYQSNGQNQWAQTLASIINIQTRGILELALAELESLGYKQSDTRTPTNVERDLITDLRLMRVEPGIIQKYRRFVVISQSNRMGVGVKDGVCFHPIFPNFSHLCSPSYS